EDQPVAVTLSGSDIEGSALSYTVVTPPQHGTLGGTIPQFIYTPHADYTGSDSFTFKVNDGQADSVPATISLQVRGEPDQPEATPLSIILDEDGFAEFTFSGRDGDGDTLVFAPATQPGDGRLELALPSLTYFPRADFHGIDRFTYTASDATSTSAPVEVHLTVRPMPDVPITVDFPVDTTEDTSAQILLSAYDADGDPLTYRIVLAPQHGTATVENGRVTFSPALNFHGTDTFTFVANDGTTDSAPASVALNILPVNDVPEAFSRTVLAVEDQSTAIPLGAYDGDGDGLAYEILDAPL
ncbi:MAG: Ig-like domain-containing protein, partial [Verrucomicrobiota bacterium]